MGKIGVSTFAKGLVDFGIIVGGVSGVVTILGALVSVPYVSGFISSGIKTIKEIFNGLWEVAIPLGAMSFALIGLGLATPATVLSGLAGFALVVDGTALIIASLGALAQIPRFHLVSWRRWKVTMSSRRNYWRICRQYYKGIYR